MYLENNDTICAPATVPGTGAISVIRVSGKKALEIADKVVTCKTPGAVSSSKGYTIRFGTVSAPDGSPIDEVLVGIFRAPHSYTGENSVEISCHASKYIVQQIMLLLMNAGARAAEPGEFTRRAFLNGKMDLAQAEAVADLIAAQSEGAHRIAYSQMKGGFSSELKEMRSQLLDIVALMELELDFSEEDVEFADRSQLNDLLDKVTGHISSLIDSFRLGNAIKNGVPVAIAGATNTGKSTLLNALLGEDRAIVSNIHGTTRDTIEGTMNIDGVLFRFIDTAGIRETDEAIEKIGIERTFRKISEADIILGMADASRTPEQLEEELNDLLPKIDYGRQKLVLLLNKCDVVTEENIHNKIVLVKNLFVSHVDNKANSDITGKTAVHSPISDASLRENGGIYTITCGKARADIIPVSAKSQFGIPALKSCIASLQKDRPADADTTLITNLRHVEALSKANEALARVKSGLAAGIPTDLAAQDIREAIYHIGSITGAISEEEVLGVIFGRFCIGK